ncbi:MAG: GNAT family N-acetyltransferase [Alphaproteobacteria bacterium]|jgi:predicted N-acyltransferase|nr:GNAT family N-acetyltransferase [Alphaproteobacteria bacterium]PPR13195.1 MAG: hypothetical protein CFH42_01617 [Alphaproteobacteria bacterium MarineAlpha12_Bin1]|tara:strand:+ start:1441 stop:2601 length:1161 start_codon:yes stop_codon:yes gene_type:complete
MTDSNTDIKAKVVENISDIPEPVWDNLTESDNPFISHAFLRALEETGCVSDKTGWLPHHLVIENSRNEIIAAAPLYIKSHSQGEYVFDHGWAHAWERAGGSYYPKMQVSSPFSPVSGPRLLTGSGPDSNKGKLVLLKSLENICEKLNISSVHVTFSNQSDWEMMGKAGWIQRLGRQFHWHNRDYKNFNDFLSELTSRKRKTIRKERLSIVNQGLTVQPLVGDEITTDHWDAFYKFYVDTYDRKWGYPYLTRDFFELIQKNLGDKVVLMIASYDNTPVAGALNLRSRNALFGRNWGCIKEYKFLHFETCYYQAIDFAIDNNISIVEAGTQGPHKIQRGYEPVETYSGHYIPNESFKDAVKRFCLEEKREVEWEVQAISDYSPYKTKN